MQISRLTTALLDILIVSIVYMILYFLKFDKLILESSYSILFFLFLPVWIVMSIYYEKNLFIFGKSFPQYFKSLLWSSALTLFVTTTFVSTTNLTDISRLFLLQISFIPLLPEILIGGIIIGINAKSTNTD